MTEAETSLELERLRKRADRERRAREEAESVAERGTRQLYERQRQLELLHVIANAANSAASAEAAVETTLREFCAFTGWPVGHAYFISDEASSVLVPTTLWHLDFPERFANFRRVTEATRFEAGQGLPGRVLESCRAAWVCDVTQDANFPRARQCAEIGVRGAFGFPVLTGLKVEAVLEFFSTEPAKSDEVWLQIATQAGTQLGRIFERKRAEAALRKRTEELRTSEEHFRLISENAGELITIVGAKGKCIYHSPSYHGILGYAPQELQGTAAFEWVHPEDREKAAAAAAQALADGNSQVLEYRTRHKDGSWRTLESHVTPFRNTSAQTVSVLVVARDVTQRKMMEVQLRQAQKLESIGQLAAGIAHEINTPTQYVGDNTRFVRDSFQELAPYIEACQRLAAAATAGPIPPALLAEVGEAESKADLEYLLDEVPKAIDQTLEGVGRISVIVQAMKEFSHPSAAEKTALDLNKAIESTLTVCRNEWKYVADLTTEFDPDLPPVPVLAGEFNQVILNLAINAAHAIADAQKQQPGQSKGTIKVSTRRDGDGVEVRVADTGSGIPEHVRERIFEPFFTTKGVGKGTGQGLAIARSVVVDKHGGKISFETETGRGTCFIIRLPLRDSAAERQAAGR